MNAQIRRRVFVIGVGTITVLAIGYGFLPRAVMVDAEKARRGPFQVTVEEEARTRVCDRFVVTAPVPGFLHRIDLEVGDRLVKGGQVCLIDPTRSAALDPRSRAQAEAAVAAAEATVNTAKEQARAAAADADYARKRGARMKKLVESGHVSQDDYEQAQSAATRAEAVRDSSRAAADAAEADLIRARSTLQYAGGTAASAGDRVIVRSPIEGRVLKLHRESEGAVNAGEPLVDIGNAHRLEAKAEVLSADAVKIKPGMSVLFERWGGPVPLEGRVRVVEPAGFTKISSLGVEEQRVLVIIDFTSPAELWQSLGDGYRLDAKFIIWEGKDVLQVPESALFRSDDGWALFAVEGGRAKKRDVKPGRRNGIDSEILSGISEGSIVITHPDDAVSDGVRVSLRSRTRADN